MTTTMVLNAQRRSVLGKQVKQLRSKGLVPATFYGKGVEAVSLQVAERDLDLVFRTLSKGVPFTLSIEGSEYPVTIYVVQRHPIKRNIIHLDFKLV